MERLTHGKPFTNTIARIRDKLHAWDGSPAVAPHVLFCGRPWTRNGSAAAHQTITTPTIIVWTWTNERSLGLINRFALEIESMKKILQLLQDVFGEVL